MNTEVRIIVISKWGAKGMTQGDISVNGNDFIYLGVFCIVNC